MVILKNIPYVLQYIYVAKNKVEEFSKFYCGLACLLMVRLRNSKNDTSAPSLYDVVGNKNYPIIDDALKEIDKRLKEGKYGASTYSYKPKLDIEKAGLLYTTPQPEEQYNTTVSILTYLYTGKTATGTDGLINTGSTKSGFINIGNVPSISKVKTKASSITIELKSSKETDSNGKPAATKTIADHIEQKEEPVVVVIDSNKQNRKVSGIAQIKTSSDIPTLHYIVIIGTREYGGIRYFSVYDPAGHTDANGAEANQDPIEYTENDLLTLMALPDNTPEWIYAYWKTKNPNAASDDLPIFILKVNG